MFLTNGFQAFSDYKSVRDDLYASTMFDSKTKPDFSPEGRILLSVNSDNWVLDVRATYESRMLLLALVKYFIKQAGGNTRNSDDVEKALVKLTAYGLIIRRLSDVVIKSDNSFNAEFKYERTLPRLKLKKINDIIYTSVEFLKKIYQCSSKALDDHLVDNVRRVTPIENNFYNHCVKDKNFLIFKTGPNLFLTNVKPTDKNIAILKEVMLIGNEVRSKSTIRQEGFNQMLSMTLSGMIKTELRIRPAIIYEQDGGVYNILHRPFLFTEKNFGEIRKPVIKAVELLSMMS